MSYKDCYEELELAVRKFLGAPAKHNTEQLGTLIATYDECEKRVKQETIGRRERNLRRKEIRDRVDAAKERMEEGRDEGAAGFGAGESTSHADTGDDLRGD